MSDSFCEPTTLDNVVFNTPGSLKTYSQYAVEATFVLIQVVSSCGDRKFIFSGDGL